MSSRRRPKWLESTSLRMCVYTCMRCAHVQFVKVVACTKHQPYASQTELSDGTPAHTMVSLAGWWQHCVLRNTTMRMFAHIHTDNASTARCACGILAHGMDIRLSIFCTVLISSFDGSGLLSGC